jgi:hypothetical protein
VSDRDSVYAIINNYRNLIHTVKQRLPRTELLISSILPRPTDYQANVVIAEVNSQLFKLEEKQVKTEITLWTFYMVIDLTNHYSRTMCILTLRVLMF